MTGGLGLGTLGPVTRDLLILGPSDCREGPKEGGGLPAVSRDPRACDQGWSHWGLGSARQGLGNEGQGVQGPSEQAWV